MKFMISLMCIFLGTLAFTSSSTGDSPANQNNITSDHTLEKSLEAEKLNRVKHPVDQINLTDDLLNSANEASLAEEIQTWNTTGQGITRQFSNRNVDEDINSQSTGTDTSIEAYMRAKPNTPVIIDTGITVEVIIFKFS